MDEFYFQRSHVPAFGSWECYDDLPFTECFESAKQAGFLRYGYSQDRDLYVTGDLYENDILTPAVIVVPRSRGKTKQGEGKKDVWEMACDYECELATVTGVGAPKAVDQDLYKISPHLLRQHPKKKKGWSIFSSCLRPTRVC